MGFGIGLGAAAQAGMSTYSTLKAGMRADDADKRAAAAEARAQEKHDFEMGAANETRAALKKLDELTQSYFGGAAVSAPSPDGGPQGPGDAPNMVTPINIEAMSDPIKQNAWKAAAAPLMIKALGPEKGIAFLEDYARSVKSMVPQAAEYAAMGDYEGAAKALRAGGMPQMKFLTSVEPAVESTGGPEAEMKPTGMLNLHFDRDGKKHTMTVNPEMFRRYAMRPGEVATLMMEQEKLAIAKRDSDVRARTGDAAVARDAAAVRRTDAEIANMPKELGLKEAEAADRKAGRDREAARDAERIKNDERRLKIEERRANTEAYRAKIADDGNKETRELRKSIDAAKSAADAEKLINSELDKLGGIDEGTGKAKPSPLRTFAPEIVLKAQELAKDGKTTVGEAARASLVTLLKNADDVGGQLAAAAAKDDKGASLAFEVADALKQNIPAREIRAYAEHVGVPDAKIGKAIAAAKEALKKEKDAPAKGLGIGARPAPASSAAAPLPPELESARQLSDRMAAEEAARRRAKHEVPAGQGLGGYVPVDELTAQPQRAGLGLGR